MDRQFQIALLDKKIGGEWGKSSLQTLNRAIDIRRLVSIVEGPYSVLDNIAMEIETISGTALGMGDEILSDSEVLMRDDKLKELREVFLSLTDG
jgi:hypothetical protein